MNTRLKLLFIFSFFVLCMPMFAKIELPALIGDNMVLQQRSQVKLWGKTTSQQKIKISPSWSNKDYYAQPDKDGNWEVQVSTIEAGGPYQIEFKQKESLVVKNVLLGEVWLCSGQSNMEMPLKGFFGQPTAHSHETIVNANPNTPIRLFTVPRAYKKEKTDEVKSCWLQNTPYNAGEFSAAGYYFAMQLYRTLQIPVGMIHSSWSASKIEAWMKLSTLETQFPEIDLTDTKTKEEKAIEYPNGKGALLYNAMIYPLRNYKIQGVIWYQGESNSGEPEQYKKLSRAWMNDWRELFNNPLLPFYITEIAPYRSGGKDFLNLPDFRAAQLDIVRADSLTAMAFTGDLGSEHFIHPPQKKEVGERLAYCALAKTYKIKGIPFEGPYFKSWKKDNDKFVIEMSGTANGLTPENDSVAGFEFLTQDDKLVPANAKIINGSSKIQVWNDSVPAPKEIRYAYKNFGRGNLKNGSSLPAAGFRIIIDK